MKRASLSYLTREGFRNIWVNRLLSLATVVVLVSCLIIVGSGTLIFMNINSVLKLIEGQNVVMVYVKDGTSGSDCTLLGENIKKLDNIRNVEFVSKEDAFKQQKKSFGSNAAILDGLTPSILPDAYKVTVDDLSKFKTTVDSLKKMNNVLRVRENSDLANKLENIRNAVTYVSGGVVLILFFVSMFIVSNTIRITIYNRRLEISIMKAVGATNRFIRWPFIVEGILLGLISSVVALGFEYGVYSVALIWFRNILQMLGGQPVEFAQYAWYLFGVFAFVGIVVGTFGSVFSLNKYLKEHGNVVENS